MDVVAGDSRPEAPGFLSKYAAERLLYPAPELSRAHFISHLLKVVKRNRFDVLLPVHDFDLLPIAQDREMFSPHVKMALPPQESLEIVSDKARTTALAERLGIPVPRTVVVGSLAELPLFPSGFPFPAVIKPRRQVSWKGDAATVNLVGPRNYVRSKEELGSAYQNVHRRSDLPIVQEMVSGTGAGVAAIFKDGEPRALFTYRRIHEYPISGGPSTLRESSDDPLLKDYAERILRELRWHGVAMVEFKVDESTGNVRLMEVNGRFWGSVSLAVASGVDFPYLAHTLALEGDVQEVRKYAVGVRTRWLIPGDLLWLIESVRRNRAIGHTVGRFLRANGTHYDYESWDDPLPAVGNVVMSIADLVAVLRGKRTILGEYLGAG